jgi:hypothetical protein
MTFSTLARNFLDAQKREIGEDLFRKLETPILKKLETIHTQYPGLKISDADEAVITVTLGSYDVRRHAPLYGSFSVCVDGPMLSDFFVCKREWVQNCQNGSSIHTPHGRYSLLG